MLKDAKEAVTKQDIINKTTKPLNAIKEQQHEIDYLKSLLNK
jgi:hypothetical protein